MSRKIALWAAIVLTIVVVAAEAWLAPRMDPTRTRTVDKFWARTCGISLSSRDAGFFHAIAILDDGWYVCRADAMDAPDYFKVAEADVVATFPVIERELERRAATQPADSDIYVIQGYRAWKSDPETHARGVVGLLDQTELALQRRFNRELPDVSGFARLDRFLLEQHIRQDKWRWATIVFDAGYLIGLIWFAAWPVIRGLSSWRWGLHWGLVPVLLLLPGYLGFVGYTFTGYGPSGGVVYPWLLYATSPAGGGCTPWDMTILRHLPQLLEPLAASECNDLSFGAANLWGPTAALGLGAAIGLTTFAIRWWIPKHRDVAGAKLTG